ncbi:MAG: crossover junction endodeoxyribonuclease RuvC [bacterium]
MIILGIDPGIRATGYGIIRLCDGQPKSEGYGAIGPETGAPFPQRLNRIYEGIAEVIDTYRPDHIAVEDVFYGKNIRSTLTIGQARGVAILASVRAGIDISEYSPREVKRAVVGSGAASKEQVKFMVKKILGLESPPTPGDAADALAVALCHAHRVGLNH